MTKHASIRQSIAFYIVYSDAKFQLAQTQKHGFLRFVAIDGEIAPRSGKTAA